MSTDTPSIRDAAAFSEKASRPSDQVAEARAKMDTPAPGDLIGMGNNIAGALVPGGPPVVGPTRVGRGTVAWHDWTCTILDDDDRTVFGDERAAPSAPGRVIGTDRPLAVLGLQGLIIRGAETEPVAWDDVGVSNLGALGYRAGEGVFVFASLDDLAADRGGERLAHPVLSRSGSVHTYAAATRLALLVDGRSLLLVEFNRRSGAPEIRLVEELEGLGIEKVCGGGDMFGVITGAQEGYIVGEDVERVELASGEDEEDEEPICDIGLGDDFAVVVLADGRVFGRGKNTFGQLGPGPKQVDDWTQIVLPASVRSVHVGRFSAVYQAGSPRNDAVSAEARP